MIIWSWFDVNQSIFDDAMHKNDFYIFVPCDVDLWLFRPQICSPSYSCPALCFQ